MQSLHFHIDTGACLWKVVCHCDNGSSCSLKSDTVYSVKGSSDEQTPPLPALQQRHGEMINFIHRPHRLPDVGEHSLIYWQRGVAVLEADDGASLLAVEPESASWALLEHPFDELFRDLEHPQPLDQILTRSSISADCINRFIQDCQRKNFLVVEGWPSLYECAFPAAIPFVGHYVIELSRSSHSKGRDVRKQMSLAVLGKTLEVIFPDSREFLVELTFMYGGPQDLALLVKAVKLLEQEMDRGHVMVNLSVEVPINMIEDNLTRYCASENIPVKAVVRSTGSHHNIRGCSNSSKAPNMKEHALKRLFSLGILKYGIFETVSPEDLRLPESLILQQVIKDVRLDFIPADHEEDLDRAAVLTEALFQMAASLLRKREDGELTRLPDLHPLSQHLYNLSTSPFRNAPCAGHYSLPEGRTVWFDASGRRIDCLIGTEETDGTSSSGCCCSLNNLECRHCLWRNFCVRQCSIPEVPEREERNLLQCRMNTLLIPRLMRWLDHQSGLLQFVHRGRYK